MCIRTHFLSEGRLVEDMENKIRNTLNEIYFGKTKDIVNGLRSVQPLAEANSQAVLQVTWVLCSVWTVSVCSLLISEAAIGQAEWKERGKWELIEDILPTLPPSFCWLPLCSSEGEQKNNSTTVIWNAGIVALISGGLWFINIGKLNLIQLNNLSLSP